MIKPIAIAFFGICLATPAAFAQSATPKTAVECDTLWKSADANADGSLDAAEFDAVKTQLPQAMQNLSSGAAGSTTADPNASASNSTGSNSGSNSESANNPDMTTGSTTPAPGSTGAATVPMTQQAFTEACTKV